jgi:hypothetical protein
MMRIIETVMPMCNREPALIDKLDSSALIHNILLMVLDYALIPARLPLTIRPSGVPNDADRS